jgi:dihydropteroate synthase
VYPPRRIYNVPLPDGRTLALGERPLVMGILNVTPDSFAEAQRLEGSKAVEAALAMEAAGADIIDIGAESTRPGARPVEADEELRRLIPVLQALSGRVRVPLSVDTYKASVALAALSEGAAIINDISGLSYDPSMPDALARTGAALVVMHTRGRSDDMYGRAVYADLIGEVCAELRKAVAVAHRAGVPPDRVIVDPGIGFAKRPMHSYGVLAGIHEVAATLARPVLAGPSRKSFMSDALEGRPPFERDWGTAAAVTAAVLGGAHVVRVHAIAEMVQVVRVAEAVRCHAPLNPVNS